MKLRIHTKRGIGTNRDKMMSRKLSWPCPPPRKRPYTVIKYFLGQLAIDSHEIALDMSKAPEASPFVFEYVGAVDGDHQSRVDHLINTLKTWCQGKPLWSL